MDKNTLIGFLLIGAILIGFSILNQPTDEEIARNKHYNDSIALVEQNRIEQQAAQLKQKNTATTVDSLLIATASDTSSLVDMYGAFGPSAQGEEKFITLENELVKLSISTKGGFIKSAQLKNFQTHDSLPLILFEKDESSMNFNLVTNNNRVVSTSNMYFEPVGKVTTDSIGNQQLIMRLKTNTEAFIDFKYVLPKNNYMLSFSLKANAMNQVLPASLNSLEMQWASKIRQQEKGIQFEDRYSQIHYKFVADDVETLSATSDEEKKIPNKVKWIGFSGQFFSTILIANDAFTSTILTSKREIENSGYLKSYKSDVSVAFDPTGQNETSFRMYLGPNQYKVLSSYDKDLKSEDKLLLRKIIPLGWGIFGWVNRFMIIPMFNFFSTFVDNFGIIILLMTLVIKLLL